MTFLQSSLFWEIGGWLIFLTVGGLCIWADLSAPLSRRQQVGLLLLLIGFVFFQRFPILFINWELNPDESQLLSQAITLRHHPVYWKYVDGATMGPLSSYYVALPGYLGIPLNYVVLRWMAFLCLLVSLFSAYFTLENFFTPRTARLALLPGIAFLAFTQNFDFIHGTNEQLSLALIGLAVLQYSRMSRQHSFNSASQLFLLGFVSSLVPFAKLQGTPAVLIPVVAAFIGLVSQYNTLSRPAFWRAMGGFLAGGLSFPLLVVLLTLSFGVFGDFVQFYLIGNVTYGAEASFWHFLPRFPAFVGRTADFVAFLVPSLGLLVNILFFRRQTEPRKARLLLFAASLLIASCYAVIKPGNEFTHYLLYLVLPVCLLNGWFIDRFQASLKTILWVLLVGLLVAISRLFPSTNQTEKAMTAYFDAPFAYRYFHVSPTALEALKLAKPGEDLVVWGWAPKYNVQTQMPQGVCDNHTIRCVMGPNQPIHRARYIENIRRSKPPVFIDAVGPNSSWLNSRATWGYETFPELKEYINQHYQLVGEIDSNRVFARIDRTKP